MQPDPLYMLMRNMTQRAHGPQPYKGILGATQEKVVAYEGDGAGKVDAAIEEAAQWVRDNYLTTGDEGTLIEIRVIGKISQTQDGGAAVDLSTYGENALSDAQVVGHEVLGLS